MQTRLPEAVLATTAGQRADEILRACVHCGFCNATCPTYQLTGDELDGPRGRIYLVKDMLESGTATPIALSHLDRCLTCRACETTCPSGVAYGELVEIARPRLERAVSRTFAERLTRWAILRIVPRRRTFALLARIGRWFRWAMPNRLAEAVPRIRPNASWVRSSSARKVVLLEGCVQAGATPEVNAALSYLLALNGIEAIRIPSESCCGSLALHLGAEQRALATMAENVAALFDAAQDCEAIVSTASGCGVTVKEYGHLLTGDAQIAERARWVAAHTLDAAELVASLDLPRAAEPKRVAWHAPCTLQHGQRIRGTVEQILRSAGHELVAVEDAHLCCGSAGTYSILQPEFAQELRRRKLVALAAQRPDVIATANVGCELHLAAASRIPVLHWLELLVTEDVE